MIEVVIAMVLLAIITSVTYGVIGLGVRAWRSGSLEFQWAQEGHRALRLVREDLEHLVTSGQIPRAIQRGRGDMLKTVGGKGQLEFFALDPLAPIGASALAEIRYRLSDKSLIRQWFAQYTHLPEQAVTREVVLTDLAVFDVEFLTSQGQWVNQWTEPKVIPKAVQVRIERMALRPGHGADGAPHTQRQVLTAMVPVS